MKYLHIILYVIIFFAGYYARSLGLPFHYTSQSLIRMNPLVPGEKELNTLLSSLPKDTKEAFDQLPKETLDQLKKTILPDRFNLRLQYGPILILSNRDFSEFRIQYYMPDGHHKGGWLVSQETEDNINRFSAHIANSRDSIGFSVNKDITSSKAVSVNYSYGGTFYFDTDADGKWDRMSGINADGKLFRYTSKDGLKWSLEK